MNPAPVPERVVVVHGFEASPAAHWFGWLGHSLAERGIGCDVPRLPTPQRPDPEAWLAAVVAASPVVDRRLALVGHSLGCLTVLRRLALAAGDWRLARLVLVAGFDRALPSLPALDGYVRAGVDLDGLAGRIDRIDVLRSDNDPDVPADVTDALAARLGVRTQVVPGAGHFCAADGVTTLPVVLDALTG